MLSSGNDGCGMQRFCPDTLDALQGSVVVTLSAPQRLTFNVSLNKPFPDSDPVQSILISKPASINSSAITLAVLVGGNASNSQLVSQADAFFLLVRGLLLPDQHALKFCPRLHMHVATLHQALCAQLQVILPVSCNIDVVSRSTPGTVE